jgi:O-antigen ligase
LARRKTTLRSLLGKSGARWSVTELLLGLTLAAAILFGGTSSQPGWRMTLILIVSSALMAWATTHGALSGFRALPRLTRLFLLLVPALWIVQLIPLPPPIWGLLPGRELPARIFELIGTSGNFHPLSLTPRQTLFQLAALLPLAAVFAAALTLDERGRERCVALFLTLATVSILVGLVQMSSRGATFNFHDSDHYRNLVGFFSNRNNQGLLIAIAGVFAVATIRRKVVGHRSALGASLVVSLVFATAAIGTISRAGLLLTLLGLLIVHLVLFTQDWSARQYGLFGAGLVALLGLGYALTFNPVVEKSLARFDDLAENSRWEYWQRSYPLLEQYFPWGSGLGSFVPAHSAIERLDDVTDRILNRAHNDYLEFFIEAGVPGMLLVALFVAVVALRLRELIASDQRRPALSLPAGLTIVLVMLHSAVDYPLRTQAISVLLMLSLAFFLTEPKPGRQSGPGGRRRSGGDVA